LKPNMIDIGKSNQQAISLNLPTLIDTRLLIQANSGGGKSFAIRRLLEQTHGHVQQIVLDLEGEFSTLREKYDYVIAGKDGDTPAHPSSAKLLAKRLLELKVSAICDLYELKAHDRIRFVRYFLESLMNAPKALWHPVLVVIDEAHHFAPEKGQVESYAAVIDLCTRGRKRSFCAVLATQRLSKLHKDACAELLNKMIGRTSLDIDQVRAADELGIIGKQERLKLRNLRPGEFHIYGPALKDTGVSLVKVGSVVSTHPKVGKRHLEAPPKPTDTIKRILGRLANLPEEARQDVADMANLRKENTDLKRKLTLAIKGQTQKPCDHEPVIKQLKNESLALEKQLKVARSQFGTIQTELSRIEKRLSAVNGTVERAQLLIDERPVSDIKVKTVPERRNEPKRRKEYIDSDNPINGSQQKILNALTALENFGIDQPNKMTLAAHSGYRPKSGGYNNNLSSLRTQGLIDYPCPGLVCLTDSGRSIAQIDNPISSIEDLQQSWLKIVKSDSQRDILEYLISIYPNDVSKIELAETVGKSPGSGGFNNNLSALKTLGAIIYPKQGFAKASELLFPEGIN